MEVTVIRSPKRRKTAQARVVDGQLQVRIPARASAAEEERLVALFRDRYERKAQAEAIDLGERARLLAKRFDLPRPTSIRWVTNQSQRWGSCTPTTGEIRLSHRLSGFPGWVIDAVIVHELAHLLEADHGPAFRALAARYPLAERAEGYLLAKADEVDPGVDPLGTDLDPEDPADPEAQAGA